MNMKDIANIAGVSISTVSKVVNDKAADISESTRKKVLDVIKKHKYHPYGLKSGAKYGMRILALIIPSVSKMYYGRLLESIEKEAAQNGYALSIFCSMFDKNREHRLIMTVADGYYDGLVLVTFSGANASKYKNYKKPFVVIGVPFDHISSFYFDYVGMCERAVFELLEHKHKNIGCVFDDHSEEFIQGAKFAVSKAGLSADKLSCADLTSSTAGIGETSIAAGIEKEVEHLLSLGITAFFCGSVKIAACIYKLMDKSNWKIGRDVSLIAFEDEEVPDIFFPEISTVRINFENVASKAVNGLINFIDNGIIKTRSSKCDFLLKRTAGIAFPPSVKGREIVVIGSLNTDTILSLPHLPQAGETLMVRSKSSIPGGKGANQAIGAGRLNGQVSIIGRLGDDLKGHEIYRNLLNNNVNVEGIIFDARERTGSAYIMFDEKGNNTIAVYGGANDYFVADQLENAEKIISRSAYALIQTEIPIETVKTAINLCRKNGVKVILKPAPVVHIPPEFFKDLFLLIPNEMEARSMCPQKHTVEDQADFFIGQGIKNVIITLGEKGSFYTDGKTGVYYKAFDFTAIDTTGASDAFISALSVYLSEGNDMKSSIVFASYAAGLSVTKAGVQTSLPGREQLRDFERNSMKAACKP